MITEQGEKLVAETKANEEMIVNWVEEINEGWKKNVEQILALSTRIAEIKDLLKKNRTKASWTEFCKRKDLNITRRTIDRLVTIGNWELKDDPAIVHRLPATWGTIYELAVWNTTDDKDEKVRWDNAIKLNQIHADITRAEVGKLKSGKTTENDAVAMIKIEINEEDYKVGDAWNVEKLIELKEKVNKSLANLKSIGVSVNLEKIEKQIKDTNDKAAKAVDMKPVHEYKIRQKLRGMLAKNIKDSKSYEKNSVAEIDEMFFKPETIENYISKLKKSFGFNKAEHYGKCFMGLFDEEHFKGLLK
jgi:hypothetical protein